MEKLISRILLVGNDREQRTAAIATVARTGARLIIAQDARHAVDEMAEGEELPHLIIHHLDRSQTEEPLQLYRFVRGNVSMHHIPFLFVVETEFENTMLNTLRLENYFCVLSPLSYASLIFALPALGIRIKDSILFQTAPIEKVSDPDLMRY